MRRSVLVLGLLALAMAACGRGPQPPVAVVPAASTTGPVAGLPLVGVRIGGLTPGLQDPAGTPEARPGTVTDAEAQQKYDTALAEGVSLVADRKWADAVAAFETALSFKNDDGVAQAVKKLKSRIEQESAAERITADIQAILNDGQAEDAAKLATDALQQFGTTAAAAQLTNLSQQANALTAVQGDGKDGRLAKAKEEYEAAIKDKNSRAAALALEQALQNGGGDDLKPKLDEIRTTLTKFEELRARAAELRKDPAQLEDAETALNQAAELGGAAAVQQDLDDVQFAIQNRRERLAVAEFELRGDVGVPQAGAFVADEILTAFKGKYDLVERGQLDKLVAELKLENGLTDDDLARQKVGQAAKVRYLVVGSVTPIAGITVQARLVDTKTGLIVQTAKITAANQDELIQRLPQLGQVLAMTDEQKRDFEQQQMKDVPPIAVEVLKPDPEMALPPPPELPGEVPPPPIMPARLKPPAQPANLQPAQFANLPPPPPDGQAFPVVILPMAQEVVFRRRSAFVSLELGDNLFRRGRFREALVQFEFCLNLFPEQRDVRVRVERCRPLLPPIEPVVVVAVPVVRPRIAVLDFLTFGDPGVVPPYLGAWTAEQISPYFCPQFEIVDRTSVYWWMGRLGVSQADLLNDPVARQYLGRALGVRYFLFGNLVQTASFDVYTYMVDAEYGFLASGARVHVRSPFELRDRLGEIAWLTKLSPDERRRVDRDGAAWEEALVEIRQLRTGQRESERLQRCAVACGRALKIRPNNIEVLVILQDVERQQRQLEREAARNEEALRRGRFLLEIQERQLGLARQAEVARLRAEQSAVADRQGFLQQRDLAARGLMSQAQAALQGRRFGAAVQFCESAAALAPSDVTYRELALARAKAEETARADAATAEAAREVALRQRREAELVRARAQLDEERQRRAAEELARRRFQEDRDRGEYTRLMDLAQRLSAEGKVEQAAATAQTAQRLRKTPEADRLVTQLLIDLAKANAARQGAAARADLERQLVAERTARVTAELEANTNRQKYEQLLAQGNQAVQNQQYDAAIEVFAAAKKIHATDAVLAALDRAQAAKARLQAKAEADRLRIREQEQQIAGLKQRLADAEAALAAKEYDKSVALYREAKKAAPTDIAVLTGLTKAEQLRDQNLALTLRATQDGEKKAAFQKFLDSGRANLEAKKYTAAAIALGEAVKLDPNHSQAKDLLAQAKAKTGTDAAAQAEMQKKAEQYRALIGDGRRSLAGKQYDDAQKAFRSALALVPGDAAAKAFLDDAGKAKLAMQNAQDIETRKRQADAAKTDQVKAQVAKVRQALAAGNLKDAAAAYRLAAAVDPNHPDVVKAMADVRKAQDAAEAGMKATQLRDAQFTDLMTKGRAALDAKKVDDAVRFLTDAAALKPADPTVRILLGQAGKLRDDTGAAAIMVRGKQVAQLLADAKTATFAKRFADAARSLDQAAALAPNDPAVARAQNDLKTAQGAMAAADADLKKRQLAYQTAILAARADLQAKKFDDALKSVATALQAMPNDKDALSLQQQIDQAKKAAAGTAAMDAKKQEYARQMTAARGAFAAKQYDAAQKALAAATAAIPGDRDAAALATQIEKAKADAIASAKMEADKKRDFGRLMLQARTSMAGKKYDDALRDYTAALALFPTDADAIKGVADAKKALEVKPMPMPPMPPKPMPKPLLYTRQMDAGAAAEKQGRYDQAITAYKAALRSVPGDGDANNKVDFCQAMLDGAKAMQSRKFPDAVKAYEAALKLFPDDQPAKQALQKAKSAK